LTMGIAFRPLDITELEAVVDLPPEVDLIMLVQKRCFAFVELCDKKVYFSHQSARDFIRQDMKSYISHAHSRVVALSTFSIKTLGEVCDRITREKERGHGDFLKLCCSSLDSTPLRHRGYRKR